MKNNLKYWENRFKFMTEEKAKNSYIYLGFNDEFQIKNRPIEVLNPCNLNYIVNQISLLNGITKDNVHLYYEFMSDEDLNTIDYDFIQNLDLAYRQHKVLGKIFETENSFKIIDLQHKFASYRLLSFKPKELLFSRTQIGIDYKIFGVKDTLKPIDEYIEEIKQSEKYKEYINNKA